MLFLALALTRARKWIRWASQTPYVSFKAASNARRPTPAIPTSPGALDASRMANQRATDCIDLSGIHLRAGGREQARLRRRLQRPAARHVVLRAADPTERRRCEEPVALAVTYMSGNIQNGGCHHGFLTRLYQAESPVGTSLCDKRKDCRFTLLDWHTWGHVTQIIRVAALIPELQIHI